MSQIAPTSGWRLALPTFVVVAAMGLLCAAFLSFSFHDRLDGYVQVEGTVQTAVSGSDVGLDATAYEVKYEIDGSPHVGVLASSHVDADEGDSLRVMAPADGSPFSLLRLPASGATVVGGWLSFLAGLAAVVAGTVWLVRASLRRNRALRELTWAARPPAGPGWNAPPAGPFEPSAPPGHWPLGTQGPGLSSPQSYDVPAPAPSPQPRPEPTRPESTPQPPEDPPPPRGL